MLETFIFVAVGLILLAISFTYHNNDAINSCCTSLSVVAFLIAGIILGGKKNNTIPDAIDVYRNKTELKVSFDVIGNDTIIKDSVVVFKI